MSAPAPFEAVTDSSLLPGKIPVGPPPEPSTDFANRLRQDLPDSFASLGSAYLTQLPSAPLPAPYWVGYASDVGVLLGLSKDAVRGAALLDLLSGNLTSAKGGSIEPSAPPLPYASVYSGHQFGVWAGQLGDGRALTLGEIQTAGARLEVQLKGAGPTPYSRMGDGRAVLRSSIREFLCSEAMHHLGIPTSRALCVIGSDLPVRRERMETAAVVTRTAPSFIRFGHFEHFQGRLSEDGQPDLLRDLADHVIDRHMPDLKGIENPYLGILQNAVASTADLMAQWQAVGFCHGVMNTDNMSILGLTIDYGPYGFLDSYDANHICNHTDTQGRYSYRNQPQAAYWNLFCLAQALLPLIAGPAGADPDSAVSKHAIEITQAALESYRERYAAARAASMRAKLGLEVTAPEDESLWQALLDLMQANRADYTLTFRHLSLISRLDASRDALVRDLFLDRPGFDRWATTYRLRLASETRGDEARGAAMNRVNPKFVLRNHLAETAIRQAELKDFSEVERLITVLRRPYEDQPDYQSYAGLPPDWASSLEVSCSS
jgi:uncharacterized protein YdiU (UPF0061 family)